MVKSFALLCAGALIGIGASPSVWPELLSQQTFTCPGKPIASINYARDTTCIYTAESTYGRALKHRTFARKTGKEVVAR